MTVAERFEAKTQPEPNSGCLLWTDSLDSDGYGQIKVDRRKVKAHRLAFFMRHGRFPLHALHRCHVRSCVNPDHIRDGTNAENVADRVARRGK